MPSLLEIATARRAEIEAELHELDTFLDRAENLLARQCPRTAAVRVHETGSASNVLIFPCRVSPAATADGIGASR